MKIEMKLTASLRKEILGDLRRPHKFALERVGFCTVRQSQTDIGVLLLVERYFPVADEHYIHDKRVGARIGEPALTQAMHLAYHGRASGTGVLHVHLHDYPGPTDMSREDYSSIPNVVEGIRQVNPVAPHGLLIFSADHAHARAMIANSTDLKHVSTVSVIGPRLQIFGWMKKYV
jgi:hypothetical protein